MSGTEIKYVRIKAKKNIFRLFAKDGYVKRREGFDENVVDVSYISDSGCSTAVFDSSGCSKVSSQYMTR